MKDDRVFLGHIRDAIQDIQDYSSAGRDAFMAERMRQDAVIRKFEIIGEAELPRLRSAIEELLSEPSSPRAQADPSP